MAQCLVAIGANLGDARSNVQLALEGLSGIAEVQAVRASSLHQTAPIGGPPDQPRFVNAAAVLETSLAPDAVLRSLQRVEQGLGRQRRERWAARTIDLDLLLYDRLIVQQQEFQIPHPRLSFRPFVLAPAVEVAGDRVHPLLGKTLSELLDQLESGGDFVELRAKDESVRQVVRQAIQTLRPGLEVRDSEQGQPESGARLTIVLRPPAKLAAAGPTLWLPPELPAEILQQELKAALDCVWPLADRD